MMAKVVRKVRSKGHLFRFSVCMKPLFERNWSSINSSAPQYLG